MGRGHQFTWIISAIDDLELPFIEEIDLEYHMHSDVCNFTFPCSSFSEHELKKKKKMEQLDSVTSQAKNAAGNVG